MEARDTNERSDRGCTESTRGEDGERREVKRGSRLKIGRFESRVVEQLWDAAEVPVASVTYHKEFRILDNVVLLEGM